MKLKRWILPIVGVLLSTLSYAQKVHSASCGSHVEIDSRGLRGVSSIKKLRTTDGTDTQMSTYEGVDALSTEKANTQIYQRFEVSNVEEGFKSWSGAIQYCFTLEADGHKDWRLPTHREMILILILSHELKEHPEYKKELQGGLVGYWTATEFSETYCFAAGQTAIGVTSKTKSDVDNFARCIRDL